MAISTDRLFAPPEVEVDFFGFTAMAHHLQHCGWSFEVMSGPSERDPFYREKQIVMRHHTGLTARAVCMDEDLRYAVNHSLGMSSARRPVFHVRQVVGKASDMHLISPAQARDYRMQTLDMEPYPRELRTVSLHRFSLADLYSCEAQEIIVEPQTVMGLLEEIKKLQAPELAAIRAKNRLRDPTRNLQDQPAPEWREEVSAQIITMRRAA